MRSLIFLLSRSAKNAMLEVLRNPRKLVLWGFVLLMLVFTSVSQMIGGNDTRQEVDITWLNVGMFLLLTLLFGSAVGKGLASGAEIFSMSDVNLLFPSPVEPRAVLGYGIVRMAKTALTGSLFILYQGANLQRMFGLGSGALLKILFGYALTLASLDIAALALYMLTNRRPVRKRLVRLVCVAVFVPLVYCVVIAMASTHPITAVMGVARSPVLIWTPVAGWGAEGIVALACGDTARGWTFLGLNVLLGLISIAYIVFSKPDFYEDVLEATEQSFERKRERSEGRVLPGASKRHVARTGGDGLRGWGVSALFFKHLREAFRANWLGLWGLPSILTVVGTAMLSMFMRTQDGALVVLLQALMWVQLFLIGTGRGLTELYLHYIYLIPERSFSKIVWANMETMLKVLVESAVIFSVAGAIIKQGVAPYVAGFAVYTLFSLLLLAVNHLSMRWAGADISAGLLVFVYVLAVGGIMLPGIIIAGFVGAATGMAPGLFALAAWEAIAAILCFKGAQGVLHSCDMLKVPSGK